MKCSHISGTELLLELESVRGNGLAPKGLLVIQERFRAHVGQQCQKPTRSCSELVNHYTLNVVVRTSTQLYQTQQDIVVTTRSGKIKIENTAILLKIIAYGTTGYHWKDIKYPLRNRALHGGLIELCLTLKPA
jgi:hypothetical protein